MDFRQSAASNLEQLTTQDEQYWLGRGADMFWRLFEQMSERVPAYRSLLDKQSVDRAKVISDRLVGDIPVIDKDGYLRKHDLDALTWDGMLSGQASVIAATSGSTGEPFFFPRTEEQDEAYALTAELYLVNNFAIDKKSTLYVNAFPLGIWIGGMFTYEAITSVARKSDYKLSIVNVGISKQEVVKVVGRLGQYYDQVIIGAYPPFMKDIIDDGLAAGLDWSQYNPGFIFSAESFSEGFRQYVYQQCGIAGQDYYYRSLNHYGTVDLGTMAHETPLTVLLRTIALKKPELAEALFGQKERQPTVCQYVPEMFYFEVVDGSVVCSSFSGMPLCRYDLKDSGGVLRFEEMKAICKRFEVDIEREAEQAGIAQTMWQLPLVYVFERQDFSVTYYSFQLYPEAIKKGLLAAMNQGLVTGKFSMQVVHDDQFNQSLEVVIELRPGVDLTESVEADIQQSVVEGLEQASSEFRKIRADVGPQVDPVLTYRPYESADYFKPGGKQKWVRR